ncbi:MAG: DNA recombination protein RmuC [Verrucomicrobiota bacterium]|nr:DNA recombination protein RmuC [Verrucomicrobiota bacterium]
MLFLFLSLFVVAVLLILFFLQREWGARQEMMKESFRALSQEVMEGNARLFLEMAKGTLERTAEVAKSDLESRQKSIDALLSPMRETMQKIDQHQREQEKERARSHGALVQQLDSLIEAEKALRKETALLAQSLRSPNVRGSWGEMHLKRVVEFAGLLNYCDFFEQKRVEMAGKVQRPDLLIRLPGQREIVVDAKTPLDAFLDATESADEETRKKKMQEYAATLRKHMRELSAKEYWKQCDLSPEYVILFLPAESFFSAALQVDPSLIETGVHQNILLATPTTLIAILKGVALHWKQEHLSKSAKEIAQLGEELYERFGVFCEHWNRVGKQLNQAVEGFNQSVSSLESRVLVSVRKLKEAGHMQKEPPEALQIDRIARALTEGITQ